MHNDDLLLVPRVPPDDMKPPPSWKYNEEEAWVFHDDAQVPKDVNKLPDGCIPGMVADMTEVG